MFCFFNIIQIIDASLQQAKGKKKSLIQRIQVRNKIIWSSHSCLETQRRHCVVGFVVHFSWPKMTTPWSPGMSFSVQLPYPITKLPSHHLKTQVSSGYFTRGVRSWGIQRISFVFLRVLMLPETNSVFSAFCHATFHHALIMCCNVSREGYIA